MSGKFKFHFQSDFLNFTRSANHMQTDSGKVGVAVVKMKYECQLYTCTMLDKYDQFDV